jgi:hypothetical protein
MKTPPIQKKIQGDYAKTAVRMPRDLHAEIQATAERNGRSMNAEIVARLKISPIEDGIEQVLKQGLELKSMVRQLLDQR